MRNLRAMGKLAVVGSVVVSLSLCGALMGCGSGKHVSSSGDSSSSSKSAKSGSDADSSGEDTTDYMNLKVGQKVTFDDGFEISLDETTTVTDYSGDTLIAAKVTYVNGTDGQESFNAYDWQGEDKNGAQEYSTTYFGSNDSLKALNSGDLKSGGKKTGWIFFPKGTKKAVYSSSIISDASAAWKL